MCRSFGFPSTGYDFIRIYVLICYIRWYVDLSTVDFAFSHVAYRFVLRIGTVISVVLLHHRRRYILLVAMAYLYVLRGGPSYVARAESLFMDIATAMAGRLGCWPGFARCWSFGADRLCGRGYWRRRNPGGSACGTKHCGRDAYARYGHVHDQHGGLDRLNGY